MCKCDTKFFIMPSPRKRIGYLPSEEVHIIIEKLCIANEFSQSKVTGLLVEEALRSRGVLNKSFEQNKIDNKNFINFSFDRETFSKNNESPSNVDDYEVNKKVLSDDIKLMHEFIEFKYFKKVMKRNNNIKCDTYYLKMSLFSFITFLKYLNSINSCINLISSDNTFLLTI